MEKIHENMLVFMKAAFSPFSAYFSPYYIIAEKGSFHPI